jgi:hypothetical protein
VAKVFIGVDPHKLSATIEVVDGRETVLVTGRFTTDKAGYAAMRKHVASYPQRVWAVEGSNGAGRPLAQRLGHSEASGLVGWGALAAAAQRRGRPLPSPNSEPGAPWTPRSHEASRRQTTDAGKARLQA